MCRGRNFDAGLLLGCVSCDHYGLLAVGSQKISSYGRSKEHVSQFYCTDESTPKFSVLYSLFRNVYITSTL